MGTIEARISDHRGYTDSSLSTSTSPATDDCITYSPVGGSNSTTWVTSTGTAGTAHGRSDRRCPQSLQTGAQSVIQFKPAQGGDITISEATSLGTISHINNPITATSQHFGGTISVRTQNLVDSNGNQVTFDFPFYMWETPNNSSNPDDFTKITVQSSPQVVSILDENGNKLPYRMVVTGFAPAGKTCTDGDIKNEWYTKEGQRTDAQLCAKLTQVRNFKVNSQVEVPEGFTGTVPAFTYSVDNAGLLEGSDTFWKDSFSLTPADGTPATTGAHDVLTPGENLTITQNTPDDWELIGVTCTGQDAEAGSQQAKFTPQEAKTFKDLGAECTFTSRPKEKPLTLDKSAGELTYSKNWDWTIKKEVDKTGPQPSDTEFNYTVTVTPTQVGEKPKANYTTTLTVTNPNSWPYEGVTLADEKCELTDGQKTFDLAAKETKTIEVNCTADDVEKPGSNTATLGWTKKIDPKDSQTAEKTVDLGPANEQPGNNAEITVTDSFDEFKGPKTLKASDGEKIFEYKKTLTSDAGKCKTFENTASIKGLEGKTASASAEVCNKIPPQVSVKDSAYEFDRAYDWNIEKTASPQRIVDSGTGAYTVTVTEGAITDSNFVAMGTFEVANDNQYDTDFQVSPSVTSGATTCTVEPASANIEKGQTASFDYSCDFGDTKPSDNQQINIEVDGSDGATINFGESNWADPKNKTNEKVTVSDTYPELGSQEITWSKEGTKHDFEYKHDFVEGDFPEAGTCKLAKNTAALNIPGKEATASVELCKTKAADVSVVGDSAMSLKRDYDWKIDKKADKEQVIGSEPVKYTITVNHGEVTDSDWVLTGKAKIDNTNNFQELKGTPVVSVEGGTCTALSEMTIPQGESREVDYTCTFAEKPTATKATITFNDKSTDAPLPAESAWTTSEEKDKSVILTDTFRPDWSRTIDWGDETPVTETYEHTFTDLPEPGKCDENGRTNTAELSSGEDAQATVTVCNKAPGTVEVKGETHYNFDREYQWKLEKNTSTEQVKDNEPAKYEVKVTEGEKKDSNFSVTGTFTVKNENAYDTTIEATPEVTSDGGTCTMSPESATIRNGESQDFTFECTYDSKPSDGSKIEVKVGDTTRRIDFGEGNFATPVKETNKTVTVTDDYPELAERYLDEQRTIEWSEENKEHTFTYEHFFGEGDLPAAAQCADKVNVAKLEGTDLTDDATVSLCSTKDATIGIDGTGEVTYARDYSWNVDKSADKTKVVGDEAVTYTVDVRHSGTTDSQWVLKGKATLTNENGHTELVGKPEVTVDGGLCTALDSVTIPAGGTADVEYICNFDKKPTPAAEVKFTFGNASGTTQLPAERDWKVGTETHKTVTLTDSFRPGWSEEIAWDEAPKSVTYTHAFKGAELPAAGTCATRTNLASLDSGSNDSQDVTVCNEADSEVTPGEVNASRERLYEWDITKSVDNEKIVQKPGENSAKANYTVTVIEKGHKDSNWLITGSEEITNPNDFKSVTAHLTATPEIGGVGTCEYKEPVIVLAPNETKTAEFTCTFTSEPNETGKIVTTIDWSGDATPDAAADTAAKTDSAASEETTSEQPSDEATADMDQALAELGEDLAADPADQLVDAIDELVVPNAVANEQLTATSGVTTVESPVTEWKTTESNKKVQVTDTFPEFEGPRTVEWGTGAHVFTYTHGFKDGELPVAGQCSTVDNTATLSTGESAKARVNICSGLLSLTKTPDKVSGVRKGDTITYTFKAKNVSQIELTGVKISEKEFSGTGELSALECPQPATLAPGAELVCTATYKVTAEDVAAKKIDNTATAVADQAPSVDASARVTTKSSSTPPGGGDGGGHDTTVTVNPPAPGGGGQAPGQPPVGADSGNAPQQSLTKRLATTGASVLGVMVLGGVLVLAGTTLVRRRK
ncbi:choice-of-anchor K domain-containing protein [Corynebacterium vitaeruminis]|uniref:DUF7507 domain-containing protein n=1 Tax=Corynebacterium vitaeruminis TaxID=38305 RepID=UPI0018CC168C|nr:choice-of-anchor K domain-containing protein [Corynebacterium vitaeruminis]